MVMKTYLGDSVYAQHDGWMLTLTTDNGLGASNTIHLEPEILDALDAFRERVEAQRQALTEPEVKS